MFSVNGKHHPFKGKFLSLLHCKCPLKGNAEKFAEKLLKYLMSGLLDGQNQKYHEHNQ